MKFKFLKYFTVLAEELHFGRAAQRLCMTQPPLSAAIKALELEVGVQLFERSRTKVQLTPAGSAFLVEATRIVDSFSQAKSLAVAVGAGTVGRLEIGFSVSLTYRGILQICNQFRKKNPGIEIVLNEMTASDLFDRVTRGQLDCGFVVSPEAPKNLGAVRLKDDHFVLCLPQDHPKSHLPAIELSELSDETFVMFSRDTSIANYNAMVAVFEQAGFRPKLVHRTLGWMTTMALVANGCGIALIASSLERAGLRGVRFVPIKDSLTVMPAFFVWDPKRMTPALGSFIREVTSTISSNPLAHPSR